jgi:hypothetical protein
LHGLWAGPDLFGMPGGTFSAVYYAVFFSAGVVAKRGKRLEKIDTTYSATQQKFCHAFAFLLSMSMLYYLTAVSY